jgi:hypothetical protein
MASRVSFDGFAETVARQTNELMEMAQRLGLTRELIDGERQNQYWQAIADLPVSQDRLTYRLTVPRGALAQTISGLVAWTKVEPQSAICADVAMGTLWLVVPADQAALELFPRLIALAQEQRGHAIIFAAPAQLKKATDVWGPTTPAHTLMRKIKQELIRWTFNQGVYRRSDARRATGLPYKSDSFCDFARFTVTLPNPNHHH